MVVKKLVFRNLTRGSYSALGGIRLYNKNKQIIEFKNPTTDTLTNAVLSNATTKNRKFYYF
ncbi:hypothetical protein B1B04_24860 [Lysinibacillus sp. KCTC 33748]|nr:hypothetical protein B1B04_24860 [Lysinibacillus sp. KCTC 33748]SKC19380.1 hypothetical protein SAMN06295926_1436 [Lysinibacillus sp. AC-3]